jgi:hypothetical protein
MPDLDLFRFATDQCVKAELVRIGNIVNVWQLRHEPRRNFCHRIALELEASIAEREALLAIVLSLAKHPTCNPGEMK